jgi:excisionase family DNA binding protein
MDLLTVQESAALLRINVETVRRHIAAGLLPAVRIGRRVRIRREDLEALAAPAPPAAKEPDSGTGSASTDNPAYALTKAQIERRRQAIAESEAFMRELLAQRGGKPFPPSWRIIRAERARRSRAI